VIILQTQNKFVVKRFCKIFTPVTIAKFLTNWAVYNKDESVLNIGDFEGIFTIEANKRLQDLCAYSDQPAINPIARLRVNK
jgi:hypothetical protein